MSIVAAAAAANLAAKMKALLPWAVVAQDQREGLVPEDLEDLEGQEGQAAHHRDLGVGRESGNIAVVRWSPPTTTGRLHTKWATSRPAV